MAIDYHKLRNWSFPVQEHVYTEKDAILYALGVGMGISSAAGIDTQPIAPGQLQFVYERNLKALPSMAVILATPGLWMHHPDSGIDMLKVVHGEQKIVLHRALPSSGTVIGTTRVTHVIDKGADKGALVIVQRQLHDKADGALLATVEQSSFCRANGGFQAQGQPGDAAPPAAPAMPDRVPDLVCDLPTRGETALIYRLSGDMNWLHVDPEVARQAGFDRPILHGLTTFGVACHAVLKACCDYRPELLSSLAVRFSAPVFPGETIRTEIWREGTQLRFQSRVPARDKLVLSNGSATVTAAMTPT